MASIKDILDKMEDKPVRVSISSREDRLENKAFWKYYGQRIHKAKSDGYVEDEWEDVIEYLVNHKEEK